MQAPSYTAVAARQTLHRPTVSQPPSDPPKPQKVSFSDDVRQYVQRSFDQANRIPGIDVQEMQEKLKVVITRATESGRMPYIDWSTYPLPQAMIKEDREQAALYGPSGAAPTNMTSLGHMGDSSLTPDPHSRKRKSPEIEAEPQEGTPPLKKKNNAKNGLQDRITAKKPDKKQRKLDAMRANAINNDMDAIEKRKQRFGYVTPEPSPYISSRDETPDQASAGPIVGTCQNLEKNYFRLTAPPPPEVVRPTLVLEKALDHILEKWKKDHNYTYACDQFKSLRQDLTVQHVKTEFTVKVYELHARIALEMADAGEYNQCQSQLRALYRLGLAGKQDEFKAYRILYLLYTCNRADMNDMLAELTTADKNKKGVRHALAVRSALASGNYHKFFRLYNDAPRLGPYLLDMFVERERLAAMAVICKT